MFAGILVFLVQFARDVILGAKLGLSAHLDIFFITLIVPTVVEIAVGATAAVSLIPLLSMQYRRCRNTGNVLWQVMSGLGLALVALSVPFLFFPHVVCRLLWPGFTPNTVPDTVEAVRIIGAILPLVGAGAVLSTALTSFGSRFLPVLSRIIPAITVLLSVFLIQPCGVGVLPVALMTGVIIRFAVLLTALLRLGIDIQRSRPFFKGFYSVVIFAGSPLVVFALRNMHLVTERVFSTLTSTGLSTVPSDAFGTVTTIVLSYLPITPFLGIAGTVTTVILLPFMVRSRLKEGGRNLARLMGLGIQLSLALSVPSALFLLTFRHEVIQTLYGWGVLLDTEQGLMASMLMRYAPGIIAMAVLPVLLRTMQLCFSSRFQLSTALGGFTVLCVSQWIGLSRQGLVGVPLGTTVGSFVLALFLLCALVFRLGRSSLENVPAFLLSLVAASALSAWASNHVGMWLFEVLPFSVAALIGTSLVFVFVFLLVLTALTWKRLLDMVHMVMNKAPVSE